MLLTSRSATTLLLCSLSLLSAFLLFQVQPVISKFILPWFGGSPGVWTTCMLFFQVVLFLGYAYAHGLTRLPRKWQWLIHSLLVLAALCVLPLSPAATWKPAGHEDPVGRILLLLLANVALPYFVLSSTSPLVQVWFTRATGGGNPWRLYALSNVGSLVALLSYPFLIEPRWDVRQQTGIWSAAFVAFAGLTIASLWRDRRGAALAAGDHLEEDNTAPVWWQRMLWVLLPAFASVLLLAATNHLCQDVAVIPFLWVVPLSLYLITFIICFEHERWYKPWLWASAAMVFIFVLQGLHGFSEALRDGLKDSLPKAVALAHASWHKWFFDEVMDDFRPQLLIGCGAMFFGCMLCHGELTRIKPKPRHLTEFYLSMSAGGALGGLLVSLVAPHVFTWYLEWPLAMLAAFAMAAFLVLRSCCGIRMASGVMGGVVVGLALLHLPVVEKLALSWWMKAGGLIACTAAGLWPARTRFSPRSLALKLPMATVLLALTVIGLHWSLQTGFEVEPRIERVRNFYGAVSVEEEWFDEAGGYYRRFHHGGIVHGLQLLTPESRTEPLSYYGHDTGIGRALDSLKDKPDARVGVVGMGTATVAAYGQKGQTFRFYDINPDIVRIAQQQFTFVPDLEARGGKVEIVLGDARLSLEREPPQHFDVLLLDAFSGDSVPVHLLTREAFEIYQRHLNPGGIIAVHVSNRYLTLAPVVEKVAKAAGLKTTRFVTEAEGDLDFTDYVLVTNNEAFLKDNPEDAMGYEVDWEPRLWTDQDHNLFEILDRS